MRPLCYAPPAPQPRASPGPGRGPRRPPCTLSFSDAVRSAAATVAVSFSLLVGDAAVVAAPHPQPPEVCRNGGAPVEEEVRGETVTNEQLVEEAWEVVNESFLPDAGSRPWSLEMWMVTFFSPHCSRWRCISRFSRVPLLSHNVRIALSK
jgi:carboxyl-terminal processing protease